MEPASAAVVVLDHYPDEEEVEEIAYLHLEDYTDGPAHARVEVIPKAPVWMEVGERDQINAHLRDGGKSCCVVVVYMREGEDEDSEDVD